MSSATDRVTVNAPGETIDVVTASSTPPRPAQAALTTNASTRSRATFSPASAAATSSSPAARQDRPTRLRARLASSTRMISAQPQVSHACQRVSGKLAPRNAGVLATTVSPWSPPNRLLSLSASDGSATASSRVAPARYGPRSRAAATPTTAPLAAVITMLASSTAYSGQCQCSCSRAAE